MEEREILQLAERQQDMVGMPREFYRDPDIYERCRPLVVCDARITDQIINICRLDLLVNPIEDPAEGSYTYGTVDVLDMSNVDMDIFSFNEISAMTGKASFEYVEKTIELALQKKVDANKTTPTTPTISSYMLRYCMSRVAVTSEKKKKYSKLVF